jgi:predicted alpha/beta hydrolase
VTGGADLFIGAGVVTERPAVAAAAPWFVYDYSSLVLALKSYRVAMVGGGGAPRSSAGHRCGGWLAGLRGELRRAGRRAAAAASACLGLPACCPG